MQKTSRKLLHTNKLRVVYTVNNQKRVLNYKLQFMTSRIRVNFISTSDPLPSHKCWVKKKSRQNRIVIDPGVTYEEFMEKTRGYFSEKFKCRPDQLEFDFIKEVPFWKETA